MANKDYYDILGVKKGASDDEIKKAYRGLAKKFHPDLHPGNKAMEARFKEINEAYAILGDPKKRSDYDLTGTANFEPGGWPPGGAWPPGAGGGVHYEDFDMGPGGFEDVFGDIFGSRSRRRGIQRGEDIEYNVELEFMQAVKGTDVRLNVARRDGSETMTVKVPPGVNVGSRVRAAGKGDSGWEGGPNGDLYLIIKTIRPHHLFRREGGDIYLDLPVTIKEAVLGAEIKVPVIDGFTTIKIPGGTHSGQRLRIKGKGVYGLREHERGDQYVVVGIIVPKKVDADSKRLIEQFDGLNPQDPRKGLW
ncbi:MAG: DnaJ domain-containing protein [Deltaproteobacteria bacterium]|nr:DnaJ domain-containing protein [Deltaproteobacteria bacterium]